MTNIIISSFNSIHNYNLYIIIIVIILIGVISSTAIFLSNPNCFVCYTHTILRGVLQSDWLSRLSAQQDTLKKVPFDSQRLDAQVEKSLSWETLKNQRHFKNLKEKFAQIVTCQTWTPLALYLILCPDNWCERSLTLLDVVTLTKCPAQFLVHVQWAGVQGV